MPAKLSTLAAVKKWITNRGPGRPNAVLLEQARKICGGKRKYESLVQQIKEGKKVPVKKITTGVKKKAPAKKTAKKKVAKKSSVAKIPEDFQDGAVPPKGYGTFCLVCQEMIGDSEFAYCQDHPGTWNHEYRKLAKKVAKKKVSKKTTVSAWEEVAFESPMHVVPSKPGSSADGLSVGDIVRWGRPRGEQTRARIVSMAGSRRISVVLLEPRGLRKQHPIGTRWFVPARMITLIEKTSGYRPSKTAKVREKATKTPAKKYGGKLAGKAPGCHQCGSEMMKRTNRWGGEFWGCSNFPYCRGIVTPEGGAKVGRTRRRRRWGVDSRRNPARRGHTRALRPELCPRCGIHVRGYSHQCGLQGPRRTVMPRTRRMKSVLARRNPLSRLHGGFWNNPAESEFGLGPESLYDESELIRRNPFR